MIYECGITEPEGREHRYRHCRLTDAWVIGLSLKGQTLWKSGKYEEVLTAPSISCTRPGVVYEIATLSPHRNRSIYIVIRQPDDWVPEGIAEVYEGFFQEPLEKHPFLAEITQAFRSMYRWTRTFIPNAERLAINALERALLLSGASSSGSVDRRDDRLHGITGFIFEHMEQPLSVPTLASGVGLSPSRFAHLFASTFGMPAMRYVERVRMEEAKALLSTGTAPVNLIARRVGYESEFYFSRRFKVYTGLSPSLYRAQESGWQ